MAHVVVVGAGYVGLTTSVHLCEIGHRVTCVETNEAKRKKLEEGSVPWFEPGLSEALCEGIRVGRWQIRGNLREMINETQLVVIAVGTPTTPSGEADLSAVHCVIDEIAACVDHPLVVAVKSTVPVGTCRKLQSRLEEVCAHYGRTMACSVVSWPEFLKEGTALQDVRHPDRVVVGGDRAEDRALILSLEPNLSCPFIETSLEGAELGKLASNAFLATKISFAHELAELCETSHVRIEDVTRVMESDLRIAPWGLSPGIGYGGSCFPKDVRALESLYRSAFRTSQLLPAVIAVNQAQPKRLVDRVEAQTGPLADSRVCVWGLSYKVGTSDVRDSPSILLVEELLQRGVHVTVHDPYALDEAHALLKDRVTYATNPLEGLLGASSLWVITPWSEYFHYSPEAIARSLVGRRCVVDIRRAFASSVFDPSVTYLAVGHPVESS